MSFLGLTKISFSSPSGEQFASCKEAAAYLQSYFGLTDANQPMCHRDDNTLQVYRISSQSLRKNWTAVWFRFLFLLFSLH